MKLSVDLHIHSALSPCGDQDMTPANIVNMAYVKGLDAIAITDHNAMHNVKAAMTLAEERDILVVPGIEVTTKEEVHVLCYFRHLEGALKFSELIFEALPKLKNKENVFGQQLIFDDKGELKGKLDRLLLNRTAYSIYEVGQLAKGYEGVMVPAHIDKRAYSLLSILGFLPKDLEIATVEVSPNWLRSPFYELIKNNHHKILCNSDAHYLKDIHEPKHFIQVKEKSLKGIIQNLL